MTKTCYACAKSYTGDDKALRCRISSNGRKCAPDEAETCREYEPGTDAEELPWFKGGWCTDQGRGD